MLRLRAFHADTRRSQYFDLVSNQSDVYAARQEAPEGCTSSAPSRLLTGVGNIKTDLMNSRLGMEMQGH